LSRTTLLCRRVDSLPILSSLEDFKLRSYAYSKRNSTETLSQRYNVLYTELLVEHLRNDVHAALVTGVLFPGIQFLYNVV
jgi:hypothetical protein